MKRIVFIITVLVIIILGSFGCTDDSYIPKKSCLKKYPELKVFCQKLKSFRGGESCLDVGILRFYFKTKYEYRKYLIKIDKDAVADGWKIIEMHKNVRIYSKNLKRYQAQIKYDIVTIKYIPKKDEFFLEWK